MKLRELSEPERAEVFENCLLRDFDRDEVIPYLKRIEKLREKGLYRCLGFFNDAGLCAYAFLMKDTGSDALLLDYFAVCSSLRGTGIGTEALGLLLAYVQGCGVLIVEIEDPDTAKAPEEAELRNRRRAFYRRAGVLDTSLVTCLFGVQYRVMAFPLRLSPSGRETEKLYTSLCRTKLGAVRALFALRTWHVKEYTAGPK